MVRENEKSSRSEKVKDIYFESRKLKFKEKSVTIEIITLLI